MQFEYGVKKIGKQTIHSMEWQIIRANTKKYKVVSKRINGQVLRVKGLSGNIVKRLSIADC